MQKIIQNGISSLCCKGIGKGEENFGQTFLLLVTTEGWLLRFPLPVTPIQVPRGCDNYNTDFVLTVKLLL